MEQIQEQVLNVEQQQISRMVASIVLAAVGDAIGYKNGEWEFTFSGEAIYNELCTLFGGKVSNISTRGWRVSDDTVMHLATARALTKWNFQSSFDTLMQLMAKEYINCFDDMGGRAPGPTCMQGAALLQRMKWNELPYNPRGGGCGGSMRAMCIGIYFHQFLTNPMHKKLLVQTAIESGRLTHNHPTGFLGSLVSAIFTGFAFQNIPPVTWGSLFLTEYLPLAVHYLRDEAKRDWSQIEKDMTVFVDKFRAFLQLRNIERATSTTIPSFPSQYGFKERDEQYKKWSFNGWGGASGDDSCIIAYEALLGSGGNWEEMMLRAAIHGGDSDSTATIAAAWFGALYGFYNVPSKNYAMVEKKEECATLAQLFWKQRGKDVVEEEKTTTQEPIHEEEFV